MTPSAPTLVWFRRDLRLADHPALAAAAGRGGPVIPIFVWHPGGEAPWEPGAASRWWLHYSLAALAADLTAKGSRLILRLGPPERVLPELAQATGATAVAWSDRTEPAARSEQQRVAEALAAAGIDTLAHAPSLLHPPGQVMTGQGPHYKVFTPYWRAARSEPVAEPLAAPARLAAPATWPDSELPAALDLLPRVDWAGGLRAAWQPGEAGAHAALREFLGDQAETYANDRDIPALRGTSRLSPHLAWGEISPREIFHTLRALPSNTGTEAFERQLFWRDFAHDLLFHCPHTADAPLHPEFAAFPWRDDPDSLRAWQRGQTGYPIVDAGMRQLWETGWMHNRVRMIVASFLVKDLLLDWRHGARWFWDTLVDADLANNTFGWQWAAGCGADAAPYFRIFNPVLQGEKFDPNGEFVRKWVRELGGLERRWIHKPWQLPESPLAPAGRDYPPPLVDHRRARDRALAALATIKKG